VTFQFFDAGGKDRGIPWRMLARKVDFDPLSLTYKKPVATGLLLIHLRATNMVFDRSGKLVFD